MEQTRDAYNKASDIHNKKTEQHKKFVEHLSIISQNHKNTQEKQLAELMAAMSPGQHPGTMQLDQVRKQGHVVEKNEC